MHSNFFSKIFPPETFPPETCGGIETQCSFSRDQWVRTEFKGSATTGRIIGIVHESEGKALYEIELPNQIRLGGMTRVVRGPHEIIPADAPRKSRKG